MKLISYWKIIVFNLLMIILMLFLFQTGIEFNDACRCAEWRCNSTDVFLIPILLVIQFVGNLISLVWNIFGET